MEIILNYGNEFLIMEYYEPQISEALKAFGFVFVVNLMYE